MPDKTALPDLLYSTKEDFKGETVAAELAEVGIDPEQILILMGGALTRSFSPDISEIDSALTEDHRDYTIVKTSREGIYDMLPQCLFHEPTLQKTMKSEQEIIAAMKLRRAEQLSARKFFVPFEATLNTLRLEMAIQENYLDKPSSYDDLVSIFKSGWKIFEYLDTRQANIFLHLIPVIHDVRDNHFLIKQIFEIMFLIGVEIAVQQQFEAFDDYCNFSMLGEERLGIGFNTGVQLMNEVVEQIIIAFAPMPSRMYRAFVGNGKTRKAFGLLCDYLFPVDCDVIPRFQLAEGDREARLSSVDIDVNAVLGQDMILSVIGDNNLIRDHMLI
jgi:type VI secretion system protein ImpH